MRKIGKFIDLNNKVYSVFNDMLPFGVEVFTIVRKVKEGEEVWYSIIELKVMGRRISKEENTENKNEEVD